MANKIIWSPRAAMHLEGICEHIAADSPVYAAIFARRVLAAVKILVRFPSVGRVVSEYGDANLREIIFGNYRIVYRVHETSQCVQIAAVCHCGRLIENVLPKPEGS